MVGSSPKPVARATVSTRFGELNLAATAQGLVSVVLPGESTESTQSCESELAAIRLTPREAASAEKVLGRAMAQITEFLAGRRRSFDVPVDLRLVTGEFRREVLSALCNVPFGTTCSYSDLGRAAGRPNAARATGSACATNPVPLVVPCHRVVRASGALGNYGGGVEMKAALLEMESGRSR